MNANTDIHPGFLNWSCMEHLCKAYRNIVNDTFEFFEERKH